jgi:hypothetical protein
MPQPAFRKRHSAEHLYSGRYGRLRSGFVGDPSRKTSVPLQQGDVAASIALILSPASCPTQSRSLVFRPPRKNLFAEHPFGMRNGPMALCFGAHTEFEEALL